jgi:hypothetical protein
MRTLRYLAILPLVALFIAIDANQSIAQLRSDVPSPYIITNPTVVQNRVATDTRNAFGLANFSMGHSYEMSFGSFGGNAYNQNMYTNTMLLDFNDRLTGRLDLSLAHSPFGDNLPGMSNGAQIFVRNAMLNYAISDRSNITIQFQQIPGGMGLYGNPYGNGFGAYPYMNSRFNQSYNPW